MDIELTIHHMLMSTKMSIDSSSQISNLNKRYFLENQKIKYLQKTKYSKLLYYIYFFFKRI